MLKVFLVIGIVFVEVLAARFACTPDSCDGIRCPSVSMEICDAKRLEFRPNSTSCGCCHLCLPYLEDGDQCGGTNGDTSFDGGPPRLAYHCRPVSTCREGICKSNATSC